VLLYGIDWHELSAYSLEIFMTRSP